MDARIESVKVTQGLLESVPLGFQQNEFVIVLDSAQREGDTQLELHVKANRQANSAEIMQRNRTRTHQVQQSCEASIPLLWHLEHTARSPTDRHDCADHRNE